MIRIVVDTNVLLSALLTTHGAEAKVLDCILEGRFIGCVSPPLLTEYQTVLARPKFKAIDPKQIARALREAGQSEKLDPDFTRLPPLRPHTHRHLKPLKIMANAWGKFPSLVEAGPQHRFRRSPSLGHHHFSAAPSGTILF